MHNTKSLSPEFINELKEFEKKHALFDETYDGWSVWRVMRNSVFREAMKKHWPISAPPISTSKRVIEALFSTLRLAFIIIFSRQKELLVKTARSGLRMTQGNKFRDVYFDGILENEKTHFKIEEINSLSFERQAEQTLFPADLDAVVFTFWGRLLGIIFPAPVMPFCKKTSSLLKAETGISVSPYFLRMRVSTVIWQSKIYKILLKRLSPKVVLVSDTGEYGLRIAAARQGIRFIELQHGDFDSIHPDAIPVWVKGCHKVLVLPDILACRGTYWIEQLSSTRQGRDHAVAVGNELIDLARERRRKRDARSSFRLVLSSQGLDSERLARWVDVLVASAPDDINWNLVIKLHPVYDANNYFFNKIKDARINVIGGAEMPNIFDLLSEADLHLSIASACHFDAAALGVPSIVIPLAGHEAMLKAIDDRHIHLATQPSNVWFFLQQNSQFDANASRYSEPGFISNMRGLLS
jgi:hypothetical protein